jgi:O-antigen/teichoic acid export membrane protein
MAALESGSVGVPERSRIASGGAMVVVGTAVFQASNFLYNSLAARALGPSTYGDLAAVVGLVALTSPLFMSVQTVASRTATALYAGGRARELRGLLSFYTARLVFAAVLVASVAALFSGPVAELLHLGSSLPIVLLAGIIVLGVISHLQRGVLLGLQRFAVFGLGSAIEGITKIAACVVLLLWVWPSVSGAIVALGVASACTIAFSGAVLHKLPSTTERVRPVEHPFRYSLETLATLVLLAMLLSTDVIAANRYLAPDLAGLYAAVSLSGKTVFFATSALTTFAFPLFSDRQDHNEDSRPILLALGGTVVVISAGIVGLYVVAPTFLVHAIFGPSYVGAAPFVPWAAVAFAGYSLVYLAGMYLLSQRRAVGTAVLGVFAVAQLAAFRLLHRDLAQLVMVEVMVLGACAGAMLVAAALGRGGGRRDAQKDAPWRP